MSTIYESIGKSVVVPHYGSKTINVRLTVSPDGKTKQTASAVKKAAITPRRRYRPRKLISDDDGSDTSENCPRVMRTRANTVVANTTINNNVKHKDNNVAKDEDVVDGLTKSSEAVETTFHNNLNGKGKTLNVKNDNIYESINNLKCCNIQAAQASKPTVALSQSPGTLNNSTATTVICRDCSLEGCTIDETLPLGTVVIPATTPAAAISSRAKRKVVRKSRSSRKASKLTDDFSRPRARSLSVGNENCYENMIGTTQEECWKSSLCRRELIEIIRDSMVKNSLCFQPNRCVWVLGWGNFTWVLTGCDSNLQETSGEFTKASSSVAHDSSPHRSRALWRNCHGNSASTGGGSRNQPVWLRFLFASDDMCSC